MGTQPARSSMWFFPFLLCCGLLIELTQSQGLSLMGPKKIRPNSNYTIVLSNTLNRNVRLQAVLEKLGEPEQLKETKPVSLSRRTVKQIEFNVGSISTGDYEVTIKSMENTFSFEQRVELEFEPKTMSIFLQTDKPVYNPGDILKFRVVAVDVDTRPVTSIKTVSISLEDSEGNSIRKWPFARLYNGVFDSAVQLASSPPLGKWKLSVNATNDLSVVNIIDVKEYVLPKYFVKAYPSRVLLATEQKVSITVETAYTFGKPVDGTVSIEIFLDDTIRKPDFTRVARITGQTTLDFDLANEIDVEAEENFKHITAKVAVMETFTNRSINITEKIPIYRLPYTVTTLLSAPAFRPGVPYPVSLVVKDHLGKPPRPDKPTTIEVNADFELPVDSVVRNVIANLDESGIASVVLEAPSNAEQLKITATYDSEEYDTHIDFIHSFQSQSQQYLKVNINPKYKVVVDKLVEFDVHCTEIMNHLSYMVASRGNVVMSSHVANINKRSYKLRIKMLPAMSPEATLIVFYTNKEYVIFDDYELKFEAFNNDFKFTLDEEEYSPGKDMYIGVYAAKDSYVAFSSIDQSVLLVENNRYDFNRDDVLKELALYGATEDSEFDWFHKRGLFLRSTAQVDTPVARNNLNRFGGIRSNNKIIVKPAHIRTMFQESWLWMNVSMDGRNAYKELKEYAPDSITTYQVSGFALSPTLGLGVIRQPIEFIVRQQFYLVANLPYSIKRGEVALIQVTVFNFLGNTVTTDVTLFNKNDEVEFVEQSSNDPLRRTKAVIVPTNNGKPVSFMVKAKKLGHIAIKFEATNLLASDAIEHMLRVAPESHLYEKNEPRFIDNTRHEKKSFDFNLDIPRDIDDGSARIKFSLDPDILGTAVSNLDGLIRQPSGCGEQNMLHFVPNIVVLDYLSETNTVLDTVRTKAINYLSSGYQNQLRYKRPDGSFSVWQSTPGTTFLTAFVAKSLKIAAKYITVDNNIVNSAFAWLASKQSPDGAFKEVGAVIHADMQGGLWKKTTNYALTSYVMIAFGENQEVYGKHRALVQKTAQYLLNNLLNINDVYDLSLATYAMSLIKHQDRKAFLDKLIENSIFDKNATERYWNRSPVDVEVAGYALLSYIENDMLLDATPIMRWLNRQRYNRGGFAATQDTFVGLKALAKFAAKVSGSRNNYRVTLFDNRRKILKKFDIDNRMTMTIQEVDIESDIRKMRVEVDGIGNGVFQIAYQYYLNIQVGKPSFDLAVEMLNTTTYNVQHLDICVKYKPKEAYERSNMALVEIFFPSGLIVEADAIKDKTGGIRKIERRFADTSVVVYYDNLGAENECFRVTAIRRFKIALHLPSYITVYDYYHKDRFAIQKYEGKVLQLCDICEDEDCETLSCGSQS